jgi:hypothetical protein
MFSAPCLSQSQPSMFHQLTPSNRKLKLIFTRFLWCYFTFNPPPPQSFNKRMHIFLSSVIIHHFGTQIKCRSHHVSCLLADQKICCYSFVSWFDKMVARLQIFKRVLCRRLHSSPLVTRLITKKFLIQENTQHYSMKTVSRYSVFRFSVSRATCCHNQSLQGLKLHKTSVT